MSSAKQSKGRGRPKSSGKANGKGKGKGKPRMPITQCCGLTVSVNRVRKDMREGRYAPRLGKLAPIVMASVLEYCVAEVLELAGNVALDEKRKTIGPRHVMLAVRGDEELNVICKDVVFPHAGAIVHVHETLLQKKKKAKKKKTTASLSDSQNY
eukprot:CAMPEP_0202702530 /NCGR_PEP_ID=MMETSP1385-20130828/15499_1 /ASSEMBLY_ACC=CAM_ASM_000861 /TAXON_ID=933848 /ORGANISM="Elphidium margaritaceum" /LENGTH=153 /DNA_ID=CAMNT_0049360191 /DNA_START=89 /DNA_END=550 /DNA_ORIENTATION=-